MANWPPTLCFTRCRLSYSIHWYRASLCAASAEASRASGQSSLVFAVGPDTREGGAWLWKVRIVAVWLLRWGLTPARGLRWGLTPARGVTTFLLTNRSGLITSFP